MKDAEATERLVSNSINTSELPIKMSYMFSFETLGNVVNRTNRAFLLTHLSTTPTIIYHAPLLKLRDTLIQGSLLSA